MTPPATSKPEGSSRGPFRVRGEVFSTKQVGHYQQLTIVADDIPEVARPGQFVAVDVGGELSGSGSLRPFAVARTRPSGVYGGTIDIVVDPRGPGSRWLAPRAVRDRVDLLGPLGRPFSLPKREVTCVLVGVDYAAAPLFALAEKLRDLHCSVHVVLGASTEQRLLGVLEARRTAQSVTVATSDGSVGMTGSVIEPLRGVLARSQPDVVYAAAPLASTADLRAVAAVAADCGAWSQTMLETSMPCSTGLCHACPVPVLGDNWHPRVVRACTEGPVFPSERVRFDAIIGGEG